MSSKTNRVWGFMGPLVAVGLLVACYDFEDTATPRGTLATASGQQAVETPVSAVTTSELSPNVTPQPTHTPVPSPSVTATSPVVDETAVTPLATAAAIRFAGWSPDSRWVAYWVLSQEDVVNYPPQSAPQGTLHFSNIETGDSCAVPEFANRDVDRIRWSDDGAVLLFTADSWFTGQPCQAEPFALLTAYTPEEEETLDRGLSPDRSFRAATTLLSSEGGILTFETTLTGCDSSDPLQRVTWKIDERLGDYDLMGEWTSSDQFLIYETLTQGPLILDVNRGVIPVLSDLFGLSEVPSILDANGYGLRAVPAPGVAPQTYHLLLTGLGMEESFPPVMLYHAENGLVETLPYQHLWWQPFSADRHWLLMDARPIVGGHESHAILTRPVEDINGEWQLLATGVDAALWTADGTEMAFSDGEIVTWQTFPETTLIGRWDTGQFNAHPLAWSPNRRFLAAEGNVPGKWEHGLFALERHADSR